MNFKAAIFDMDGLMIDSMIHWKDCDDGFYSPRGIVVDEKLINRLTGRSMRENLEWMKEVYNLKEDVEDLIQERIQQTDQIYTKLCSKMPGTDELIKILKENSFKQAVASGSSFSRIEIIIDRFGWRDYFEHLISADHVNDKSKPDPGIYLLTAEKLECKPEECVVFEDAENGVIAAKRAGMACIAVLDKRWSFGDFSEADLIVDSLEDKKVFEYLALI